MTSEDLKQQIAELRKELEYANETDVHVKDMFGSLMEDIVVLVSEESSKVDSEGVKAQLEQQATDFESNNPRVADIIRQIMDQLAKLGI